MQFSKCTLASIGKRPAGSGTCSLGELALLCGRREWREYRHNWESLIGTCQQTNKQLIPTTLPDGASCTRVMSGEFQKKKTGAPGWARWHWFMATTLLSSWHLSNPLQWGKAGFLRMVSKLTQGIIIWLKTLLSLVKSCLCGSTFICLSGCHELWHQWPLLLTWINLNLSMDK